MAEKQLRAQQYEYNQNANLVLQPNRDLVDRVSRDEATGEVETLKGRLGGIRMGDRAFKGQAPELIERKKRRAEAAKEKLAKMSQSKKSSFSVRHADLNLKYYPKTTATQTIYEMLLSFITEYLGSQPEDILMGAADEVLETLKSDDLKQREKQADISSLLGHRISEKDFTRLTALGVKITDYHDQTQDEDEDDADPNSIVDEDPNAGVALIFDGDEDEDDKGLDAGEDDDLNEVRDDFGLVDDADVEQQEAVGAGHNDGSTNQGSLTSETFITTADGLDPKDIDAFWLQRQLGKYSNDAVETQRLADQCYAILEEAKDDRDCENRLIQVLQFDKFDFVKVLRKHRRVIFFCTKRARAQSEAERRAVEAKMLADDELATVLRHLKEGGATTASERKQQDRERRAAQRQGKLDADLDGSVTDARVKKILNLEDMAFAQGGHLMANRKCELPKGASRIQRKGYEEVHVPARKLKEDRKLVENLVAIGDLPDWAQKAFKKFKNLNVIQSKLFPTAFGTDENLLVCAPTGAGKTNVALLTILREIGKHINENDGSINRDEFKIVYIAPMKSLVAEQTGTFSKRLEPYDLVVEELTGDRSLSREQIFRTNVLVCTPEKWDVITRKGGFEGAVNLIIIDEIHLLHDDRGPVLESIVARSLRQVERTSSPLRLVGLSATLPNYEDVSTFMRVDPAKGLFFFDNSFRPCPLEQVYIGISERKAIKKFQMMNEIVYEKVATCAGKHQVIVFTHSRKDTAQTAKNLRDTAMERDLLGAFLSDEEVAHEILRDAAERCASKDLTDLLPYGFACHHAGMSRADRTLVEELFAAGHVKVLCSTATLAWGVNLPAHTVIIKGTQVYSPEKGGWTELSFLDILQMIGRAGRPQYDKSGEGILVTSHNELQFYLSLQNEQLPVESQLIKKLPDNLNAEIVAGTVQNVQEGVEWLSYTYLFVRMLRNPTLYGISHDELRNDPKLEQVRANMIHTAAMQLDKANLVKYDKKSGQFQVTDLGRIASHYYCDFKTISMYNNLMKPTLTDIELLRIFSRSSEFEFVRVREEEKMELQTLMERVPIPIKESVDESTAKVNALLQAYISRLRLDGFSLASDMVYITQSAGRLIRALFEIALRRGWCGLTERTLAFCKMIDRRMWQTRCPLRQFPSLNADAVRMLERKNFDWEELTELSTSELGEAIRQPKMGKTLHKFIHSLPKVELSSYVQPITRTTLKVMITITPDFRWDDKLHGSQQSFWVFAEDGDGENILHAEYFVLKKRFAEEEHTLEFYVPISDPMPPQYFVRIVSDRWIGSECVLPISFRHLLLPEKFPPHSDLLDLQPLPITALKKASFQKFYVNEFDYFNPIQTQVFSVLYNSDDNILIGAPTGSGKTVCAELAILRNFVQEGGASGQQSKDGQTASTLKCVYVAPKQAICDKVVDRWRGFFTRSLGLTVVKLTGDTSSDLKLLSMGNIIVATAEQWDVVSRRWKQRKLVQRVSLFIADEAHLIGAENGPVMEVVCSRMRYMSAQLGSQLRMVVLGAPIANAKEIGAWCGVKAANVFNFHPNVRPVPLELYIQGFTATHAAARLMAMARPVYNAIKRHSPDKPTIVFVPSKKQAIVTAAELYAFAAAEGGENRFVHSEPADLEAVASKLSDENLREMVLSGVGYIHESLSQADRAVVEHVYRSGAIQLLVVPVTLAWELTQVGHLVVIQDTQTFDGKDHRYVDYPIPLVLQMMGYANRPRIDHSGKCVVLCHTSKKQHFSKFLYEPLPVESHLDHLLHDHFNAEVVTKIIEQKQDAVDYLTWTLLYRRMTQNPNYYNLTGVTHRHLSDHLSELVESTLAELEESKCIAIDEDTDSISPLNLGMIAAYYYIDYSTIALFSKSLSNKTKMRGLLEILCAASEFEKIPVRYREDRILRALGRKVPLPPRKGSKFNDPHVKAYLLIQAHMTRIALSPELQMDLEAVLKVLPRLLQACVDVLSSSEWLSPAITAMELSQFITQAMWTTDPVLKQLPHVTDDIIQRAKEQEMDHIDDIMEAEDEERDAVLQLPQSKLADVARFCNRYPSIDIDYEIEDKDDVNAGTPVFISVTLDRDEDEEDDKKPVGPVIAPFYPLRKEESWWCVVGDPATNSLLAIKRISLQQRASFKLDFIPRAQGEHEFKLYFMCDAYLGCDQEYDFKLSVGEAVDMDSDDDSDEEDGSDEDGEGNGEENGDASD